MTEAFCVRCRKNVEIQKEKQVKLRNGKYAKKGVCPNCGANVFRIVKKEESFVSLILSMFGLGGNETYEREV